MHSVLTTRKRAEAFDAIVDGRPTDERHADLAGLATVVTALREAVPVAPRADFTASLREQLMAEAATVLTGESRALALPTRQRGPRERRLVAAATAVVFVGGTAGMAVASQNALPGDTLYPIKRTIERAQASLSTNDAGRGHELLGQAHDRLGEVKQLLGKDGRSAPEVPATIDDFSKQAQEGADLLVKSFQDNQDPKSIESVRTFVASSLAVLQELAKTASPDAQESLTNAAYLLEQLDQQALDLCSTCASNLPPLQITDLLKSSATVQQALQDATRLPTAKPSTKAPGKVAGKTTSSTSGTHTSTKTQTQQPAKAPLSSPTVKPTTKKVDVAVNQTVDTVKDVLNTLVPGTGDLLGDVTGSLLGGTTSP